MLYEAAHFIKDRLKPVWNLVEWGNAQCFGLRYRKGLNQIPEILNRHSSVFTVRLATEADAPNLAKFFEEQPEEAFKSFKPHAFDEKSLKKIIRNQAFITFLVLSGETIVGYFFLRSFVNGKSFRGKIVDYRWQGRGIAKLMGKASTDVASILPSLQEGLPVAMMEAMACGIPVVSSNIRGSVDLMPKQYTNMLSAPFDEDMLALHIKSLIEDDAMRKKWANTMYVLYIILD